VEESAARIAESHDSASALPALQALCDERLLMAPDGALFYKDDKGAFRIAATRAVASPAPEATKVVEMNNSLRRAVLPLIARLRLVSSDTDVRLAAVNELAKRGAADGAVLLRAALEKEHDSNVREAMQMVLAKVDLSSTDREQRLKALAVLKSLGDGSVKSELAALVQQHYGPGLDARHLPGSWRSTDNGLEGLLFSAKDAVTVVDDFAPCGGPHDIARWHQRADRIVRAQGNNAGRGRMRADGTLRPPKPPRGMVLSTGEEIPKGQSLRTRMLILEISKWDIARGALTRCWTIFASN